MAEKEGRKFVPETRVFLASRSPSLKGARGTVKRYVKRTGMYEVLLDSGKLYDAKESLLRGVAECYKAHLDQMPLTDALFWFIENIGETDDADGELFRYLRERHREHQASPVK